MNFSRFNFEQQLLSCWTGVDDIQYVIDALDSDASNDTLRDILVGIQTLLNMKHEKTFKMFEAGITEGKIV